MKCDTCKRRPRETCGILSYAPDGCHAYYVLDPDAVIGRLKDRVAKLESFVKNAVARIGVALILIDPDAAEGMLNNILDDARALIKD
jgi:hypothetical protein